MGLLNKMTNWIEAKYQKRIQRMQAQGKCPDCYGNGFHPMIIHEIGYTHPQDLFCTSCNGSGSFADWEAHHK